MVIGVRSDQVYRATRLVRQFEIPFTAMAVIHRVTARHAEEVYRFLSQDLGCAASAAPLRRAQGVPHRRARHVRRGAHSGRGIGGGAARIALRRSPMAPG